MLIGVILAQTCQYFDTHNFKIPTDYLKVFIWYTRPAKVEKKKSTITPG